jgi:hypothetical protein
MKNYGTPASAGDSNGTRHRLKPVLHLLLFLIGTTAAAQSVNVARVADDARVVDRVAEASKRDLPKDLLRRIVDEDIDTLRGKRPDGTYQYAGYERMEASRKSEAYSIEPHKGDQFSKIEVRADFAYRIVLSSPSRRMLVTKNRRVWVDHVDIEYMPQGGRATKLQTVKLGVWIDPGVVRNLDLDEIARQATAKVYARADNDAGYGNLVVSVLEARVFDNPDSPYADAVASLKSVQKALDNGDVPSIRASASRVADNLGRTAAPAVATRGAVDVVAPRAEPSAIPSDVYGELQSIEDLMTGSDAERRQGLDRLHQVIRKLRPQAH